jgi:thiol-disulfide isomerase/thioredoxin
VRKINLLILTLILFVFTACEDKKRSNTGIPVENTTEFFGADNNKEHSNTRFKIHKKEQSQSTVVTNTLSLSDTFKLNDIKNTHYTVTVSNQKVTLKENTKAIVLVTFFATWCPPCLADIPYMNDLQKKYKKDLLIAGILIHDNTTKLELKSFLAKHNVKYFISTSTHNNDFASLVAKTLQLPHNFSIPLTVMYVEGEYFTHYEGCVPVEMIEYDIQQALKTIK